jgi:hypothetical protein
MPDLSTARSLSQEYVMSDTYPWNEPADSADAAQRALQAVQFALDRRDNGGDAGADRD